MQERQFPHSASEQAGPAEQSAKRQARARPVSTLGFATGATLLALFLTGCPDAAELDNPQQYPLPPAGSTAGAPAAGGSGGGNTGSACESACMATIINRPTSGCKACHGTMVKLAGTLDLESPGYTARLKDKPSEHPLVEVMNDCPTGDKLIDSANPANSWLLKKVNNMHGMCGAIMPLSGALPPAEQACVAEYVTCVAGGAPAGTGTAGAPAGTGGAPAGTSGTAGSGGTGGT